MQQACVLRHALPLKVIVAKIIIVNKNRITDFRFLSRIIQDGSTPEYNNCFDAEIPREEGYAIKPATTAVYTPIFHIMPSDPNCDKVLYI